MADTRDPTLPPSYEEAVHPLAPPSGTDFNQAPYAAPPTYTGSQMNQPPYPATLPAHPTYPAPTQHPQPPQPNYGAASAYYSGPTGPSGPQYQPTPPSSNVGYQPYPPQPHYGGYAQPGQPGYNPGQAGQPAQYIHNTVTVNTPGYQTTPMTIGVEEVAGRRKRIFYIFCAVSVAFVVFFIICVLSTVL